MTSPKSKGKNKAQDTDKPMKEEAGHDEEDEEEEEEEEDDDDEEEEEEEVSWRVDASTLNTVASIFWASRIQLI
jgi:hypothetical protein